METNLRLELLAWSKIDFFLGVISSCSILGSTQVCCHRAWMVLRIPFHTQRKLPCASLFSHTSTLSTPSQVLSKNRFLHALFYRSIIGYKQDASQIPELIYRWLHVVFHSFHLPFLCILFKYLFLLLSFFWDLFILNPAHTYFGLNTYSLLCIKWASCGLMALSPRYP